MKIGEISYVLLMLMDNEHSVLSVNCYRMDTGLTQQVVIQFFLHYTLAGLGYLPCHPQEDPPQNGSRTALELRGHCLSLPSTAIKHGGVRLELVISHGQLI